MTPPKKIYLQVCQECPFADGSCIDECNNNCEFDNLVGVTWYKDRIFPSDEEYVRLKDVVEWLYQKQAEDLEVSNIKNFVNQLIMDMEE